MTHLLRLLLWAAIVVSLMQILDALSMLVGMLVVVAAHVSDLRRHATYRELVAAERKAHPAWLSAPWQNRAPRP